MSDYERLLEQWQEINDEIKEIEKAHPDVVSQLNSAIRRRKALFPELKSACAKKAFDDPQERGVVEAGPFSFSKVWNTTFDLEALAESEECFQILAAFDLIRIGELVAPISREAFQMAIYDPYMKVIVDESKLRSLVAAGEAKLPDSVIIRKQSTPAQKKGPKEDYYAGR